MKIYNIEQGSEEWFAIKYGKIGGSTLSEIMTKIDQPVKNTAKYLDILSARVERFELDDEYVSYDMERGNLFEPIARSEFERVYNKKVNQVGWVEMENEIAGISPDGLIGEFEAIEIKCPARKKHMSYILDSNMLVCDYIWQIVQYFVVIEKLEKLYVLSYRPENTIKQMVVVEVTKDMLISNTKGINKKISDFIKLANNRLVELKESIKNDIELLKKF